MNKFIALMCAGTSLIACGSEACAREASVADAAAEDEGGTGSGGNDIIVTARRRDESLQDVPQTVNAVTSAQIEKLNLQNFKDIQAVVPGLSLSGGYTGSDSGFTLRGVSFNTLAQVASPSVQSNPRIRA